jgi:RimJ/RimL family protein N-acetyltransferase
MITDAEFAALCRKPVTLQCDHVRLEPLSSAHERELFDAAQADEIWQFLRPPGPRRSTLDEFHEDFMLPVLALAERDDNVFFAVIDQASGRAIGCTQYLDFSAEHRHVEIGGTWYAKAFWRTAVNTECKYLLLTNAFETLGCIRVQLRTDELNTRSRAAIERIGGKLEGIIRHDRIVKGEGGRLRSSAQYSLLDDEWPANKARLEAMLARGAAVTSS